MFIEGFFVEDGASDLVGWFVLIDLLIPNTKEFTDLGFGAIGCWGS